MATIRVLVVEDERTLAGALEVAIDVQPDLTCVGAVGTVEEGTTLAVREAPDVVLMDIHLPGADGIEGTKRIRAVRPVSRVIMLTADTTAEALTESAAAGAMGFLAKDTAFVDVLAAIRTSIDDGPGVVTGGPSRRLVTPFLRHALDPARDRDTLPDEAVGNWAGLTVREREVLALMAEGLGPRGISDRLVLSVHTVRGHVKNVLAKVGAHSQLEAVAVAVRTGLLTRPGRRERRDADGESRG